MIVRLYIFVLFWVSIGHIHGADEYMETKAAFVKTCVRKDTDFVSCSTQAIQMLYKQLAIGIEGLEDVQFDPMKLKDIHVVRDGPVNLNTTITDGVAIGFSNVVALENYVSPADYSWTTRLHLPKLRIEGQCDMRGRILLLRLGGSGKCWVEPSGLDVIVNKKTVLYEKFDHIFFNITDFKVEFEISGLKMHFQNLFDPVENLDENTNEYLNENWMPVSEAIRPIITKSIEDNLFETLNRVFSYIPADYFISDIKHPSKL
ncbi:hypothetical protein HA402_002632 [Bradysia odoriphaga]|nr:hypothetical protein HA402_002632 [Bradysia odoriphaga]